MQKSKSRIHEESQIRVRMYLDKSLRNTKLIWHYLPILFMSEELNDCQVKPHYT